MDMDRTKCVMVVDGTLPAGLVANTAAVLGATLGKCAPEIVGPDVADGDGGTHRGIVRIHVPVLRGDGALIAALRERLAAPEYADVISVDFSDVAQGCKVYEEYQQKLAGQSGGALRYLGIGICGDKRRVNQLTGSLPLLR